MTNEEMEKLAGMIVAKIFEAEEKAQQEFADHYETMMAAKRVVESSVDSIKELEDELRQAIMDEKYEWAAILQAKIDKLKNL